MNEQEAKSLFMAQYLGQCVFRYCDTCQIIKLYPGILNALSSSSQLLLRSVNQLTDEECSICISIMLSKDFAIPDVEILRWQDRIRYIFKREPSIFDKVTEVDMIVDFMLNCELKFTGEHKKNGNCGVEERHFWNANACYTYLRSIGILLPFTYIDEAGQPTTLQPEEIIERGWAKLKEN